MVQVRASTQINNDDHLMQLDGSTAMNATMDLGTNKIINVVDPTNPQDAATKAYVDGVSQGLDVKESVRVHQDSNVTLVDGAPDTVDGVALSAGDRVLVTGQTTGSENGIYVVDTVGTGTDGTWSRAADADKDSQVTAGLFTFVAEGATHADSGWVLTTDDPITVNSTALSFSQFSGAGQITAGDGLTKTGGTIDFATADNSLTVNADDVVVNLNATYLGVGASGIEFADIGVAEIYVGDGGGTPTAVAMSGDTSISSAGAVTVLTPGTAGTTQTVKSTGSGVKVADSDGGNVLIAQGGGGDTEFKAISGDATLAADGTLTLSGTFVDEAQFIHNETPSGAIDGANQSFTTANNFDDGSERLYLNGVRQEKGVDYNVTATNKVTFQNIAPLSGDVLIIDYRQA